MERAATAAPASGWLGGLAWTTAAAAEVEAEERANWDRHRDSKTGCQRRGETPAVSRTAGQATGKVGRSRARSGKVRKVEAHAAAMSCGDDGAAVEEGAQCVGIRQASLFASRKASWLSAPYREEPKEQRPDGGTGVHLRCPEGEKKPLSQRFCSRSVRVCPVFRDPGMSRIQPATRLTLALQLDLP